MNTEEIPFICGCQSLIFASRRSISNVFFVCVYTVQMFLFKAVTVCVLLLFLLT